MLRDVIKLLLQNSYLKEHYIIRSSYRMSLDRINIIPIIKCINFEINSPALKRFVIYLWKKKLITNLFNAGEFIK